MAPVIHLSIGDALLYTLCLEGVSAYLKETENI